MTELEQTDPTLSAETEPTPEPEPEPEPWTPERVISWNSYYDIYVTLGVLLLVFLVSATKITNSSIWAQLQTGRQIVAQGAPVVRDSFSYTEFDQPWVNIPWLFEVASSRIYDLLAPANLDRRPGQMTQADQYAAGTLVAMNAIIRVLTALILLSIRRPGPGLWWAAVCTTIALGGILSPAGSIALGGVAGQSVVAPETWGMLLLALELWLLDRAISLGRPGAAYALIPLFLLWANVDDSFLTGLIVLAAAVVGTIFQQPERKEAQGLSWRRGLLVLLACVAVCLANPSTYRIYPAALTPLTNLFAAQAGPQTLDQLSVFGPTLRRLLKDEYRLWVAYYLILVGLGLGSFFLNRRRFSLPRFLVFAVMAVLWGAAQRFRADFALVFAATMILNGQEWYQDNFGTEGRLGRGWSAWSIGGRAITIVLISVFMVKGLTGYGSEPGEPLFGFGVNPDLFAFEAADTLRTAKLEGNVLNTSLAQGDALIWRAQPLRKTFIDSRTHVFPAALRAEHETLRGALRGDKKEEWAPLLDRYHISAVMLDVAGSANTYEKFLNSPNWIRFYDDGNVVMFGRSDAKGDDLAYFQQNQLDANAQAYSRVQRVESTDRPPRLITNFDRMFYDRVFQGRYLVPPQPHVRSASRWLEVDPNHPALPDPAHCLMAVKEARTALAHKPDDPDAFRVLSEAYKLLMLHESALLAGETLTMSNMDGIAPQPNLLSTRFSQRATALNFALQTTPPPKSTQARRDLATLNFELGQLYLSVDFLDLGRDRLQEAMNVSDLADISPEFRQRVAQLDEQVKQIQAQMAAADDQGQVDPVQKAQYALRTGAVGTAIDILYDTEQAGGRSAVVRPMLLDLFCRTGQPDRAIDLLGNTEDPSLNSGPGTAARRQGLVSFLVGNADYAALLWEDRALPQLHGFQVTQALGTGQSLLKGEILGATRGFLELPEGVNREADWEFDLGLCLLESGEPARAALHFTNALTIAPKLPTRPVIAYYLEKMGKTVPPLPVEEKSATAEASKAEAPAQAKPDEGDKPKDDEADKPKDKAEVEKPKDKPKDGTEPSKGDQGGRPK
jgi:tetratricopeptide (TPR) repeat protein